MKIDMTGVDAASGFEALPKGWYRVAVTDVEDRIAGDNAKNPGSEGDNFTLVIQDGKFEGRRFWFTAWPSIPNALPFLKGFWGACGFDVDGEIEYDRDEALGCILMVQNTPKKRDKNDPTSEVDNNVSGFKKDGDVAPTNFEAQEAAGNASMLP